MKFQPSSLLLLAAATTFTHQHTAAALAFSPSTGTSRGTAQRAFQNHRSNARPSATTLSVSSTSDKAAKVARSSAGAKTKKVAGNAAASGVSNPFAQWMPQQNPAITTTTKTATTSRSAPTPSAEADSQPFSLSSLSSMDDYTKGFAIIGFITFLNATTNPLWHGAFANGGPPPLLLNAAVAVVAWAGLVVGGSSLDSSVDSMKDLAGTDEDLGWQQWFGGVELGFWKFLGTTSHLYGLSMTSANHGAFLIQLTTLIVPVIQGLRGEKIPRQIQAAVALALLGVYAFTQDPNGAMTDGTPETQAIGDALCVACAFFYSFYDIQTFKWGRIIPRTQLVTTKIATQAFLSVALCIGLAYDDTLSYFQNNPDFLTQSSLVPVVLWSGLIVNALATFLQVGGMQAVGPTRAQTIFASQPLWSSALAYAFLGETIGFQGAMGGTAFLFALYLAITAPKEGAAESTA